MSGVTLDTTKSDGGESKGIVSNQHKGSGTDSHTPQPLGSAREGETVVPCAGGKNVGDIHPWERACHERYVSMAWVAWREGRKTDPSPWSKSRRRYRAWRPWPEMRVEGW